MNLALAALTATLALAQSPVPEGEKKNTTIELDNDAADFALRAPLGPDWLRITPVVKGGVLEPFNSSHLPYPVMNASPFLLGGLKVRYSGPVESMGLLTLGDVWVNQHKGIDDPNGLAASPASSIPKDESSSQRWRATSGYLDVGYIADLSQKFKGAVFAQYDSWGIKGLKTEDGSHSDTGRVAGSVGALGMYKTGRHEASVTADLRIESGKNNMWRNGEWDAVPSVKVAAEYAHGSEARRVATGVETTSSRADLGVRPYVSVSQDRVSGVLAGNYRASKDPFYPDVKGLGAEFRYQATDSMSVGLTASYDKKMFPLAPGPEKGMSGMLTLTIDTDRLFGAQARYRGSSNRARRDLASVAQEANDRLPGKDYAATFKDALTNSPTYEDFVKKIPAKSIDDILSAISAFTDTFGTRNYNNDEDNNPNVKGMEEIYRRGRASYLDKKDDPILVCIGSAQFAANLAKDLGAQAGLQVAASAVTVDVPDKAGARGGHAVAAVKFANTEYGIVFVDWGKITPTYTYNTELALRAYQASQGIPALYHTITGGRDGRHVGYLFTDEGKAFMRHVTVFGEVPEKAIPRIFNDEPRGDDVSTHRFKSIVRDRFNR
jgi:hypothetical protein